MPRRNNHLPKRKKAPDGTAIAFGEAHEHFGDAVIAIDNDFNQAVDAHEQMQANTWSPQAASVLFKRRDDLMKLVRRLQRNVDSL